MESKHTLAPGSILNWGGGFVKKVSYGDVFEGRRLIKKITLWKMSDQRN